MLLNLYLTKLKSPRDRQVVPKAFQLNMKLSFPGTKPNKEQIQKWWQVEKGAGLALLTKAIQINQEMTTRMEDNFQQIENNI